MLRKWARVNAAVRLLVLGTTFHTLVACANSQVVDHGFSFNAVRDSPDVYVLDYRYGDSKQPSARNPADLQAKGQSLQATGIHGPMLRGDYLYVKWRVKSTNYVYEENVDLRTRLPRDLENHRIYFIVRGPQLYIYLIPPESRKRPAGVAPNGPRMYSDLDVKTIYP
jgi:hypothetical protein